MPVDDRIRAPGSDQRAAILPLFAILIVVLMGAAGFAVDLGWLYFKSIEVQHGADLAALAGVVYEPSDPARAHTEAVASARENGFIDSTLGGPDTVSIEDIFDNPTAVEHASQLRATITHRVPTFFMKLFGISDLNITRTAVAQYIEPLALGSPESNFANDPSIGHEPGFWASVHGTYGPQGWGDRYAALCLGLGGFTDPTCAKTPEGRPSTGPGSSNATGGYLYAIDVADSDGLAVEIFDGPYYHFEDEVPPDPDKPNATFYFTGDFGHASTGNPMATTWFMLYGPDATPLDTSDNELLCTVRYTARDGRVDDYPWWDPTWLSFEDVTPASNLDLLWDSMATSPNRTACAVDFNRGSGIYPLRVMVGHNDGWWTTNKYSLRVSSTSGPAPTVSGLGDMSIFANVETGPPSPGTSTFFLARVEGKYSGKTLIVELWDAGDVDKGGSGDTMTISSGALSPLGCTWTATNGDSGSTCTVNVAAKRYNDEMITVTIPIPDSYTCSGDACWFKTTYQYTGERVHDTTTWAAFIAGNPIRLVK